MNKKKIIFFDGDGTLWYPKKTKHNKHPVWIYKDKRVKRHNHNMTLIPHVLSTIRKLKKMGVMTVILSTNPSPSEIANTYLRNRVKHFKLENLFDEVHATTVEHSSKGEFILRILKERKIPKSKVLMVGDSYLWDFKQAKERGIDALLIQSKYMHEHSAVKDIKKIINKLSDIFTHI